MTLAPTLALAGIALAGLALAGCHKSKDQSLDDLDKELTTANSSDPLIKAALQDQIMVDPQLASKSNARAIRPPDEAYTGALPPSDHKAQAGNTAPLTLPTRARQQGFGACNLNVAYSALWATKLPPELSIYPQGHVSEAAGSDTPACHLRAVSFVTAAPVQSVMDFYTSHGQQSGYAVMASNEGDGQMLRGYRAKDGALFTVDLAPTQGGGASIDLVSNTGR